MMLTINEKNCTGCEKCLDACPTGAIYMVDHKAQIDTTLCNACEACLRVCPNGAIVLTPAAMQPAPVQNDAQIDSPKIQSPLKSAFMALGSTLVSLGVSKLGDFLASRLTKSNQIAPVNSGKAQRGLAGRSGARGGGQRHRRGGRGKR
ncbi:4Fe-4S binding protein [candidate division KSB1 bacterium]|nr:4Fe-4S binding protein [candidate division KSB1 bacterium]